MTTTPMILTTSRLQDVVYLDKCVISDTLLSDVVSDSLFSTEHQLERPLFVVTLRLLQSSREQWFWQDWWSYFMWTEGGEGAGWWGFGRRDTRWFSTLVGYWTMIGVRQSTTDHVVSPFQLLFLNPRSRTKRSSPN